VQCFTSSGSSRLIQAAAVARCNVATAAVVFIKAIAFMKPTSVSRMDPAVLQAPPGSIIGY